MTGKEKKDCIQISKTVIKKQLNKMDRQTRVNDVENGTFLAQSNCNKNQTVSSNKPRLCAAVLVATWMLLMTISVIYLLFRVELSGCTCLGDSPRQPYPEADGRGNRAAAQPHDKGSQPPYLPEQGGDGESTNRRMKRSPDGDSDNEGQVNRCSTVLI